MYESQGSLALKKRRADAVKRPILEPVQKKPALKTRRISTSETPDFQQQMQERAVSIRKSLLRKRLRLMSSTVALVLLVAGIFGIIVYRQAMILEMNFHTVAMEREVNSKREESSQIREWLAQNTNLDLIRQQAMTRIGLQDPARSQVVNVYIPDTDRIVFHHDVGMDDSDEIYLSDVVSKIEAYFKTLTVSQRGE